VPLRYRIAVFICLLIIGISLFLPRFTAKLQADSNAQAPIRVRVEQGTQPTYGFEAGIDGEIFPAMANYASLQRPRDRDFGTFTVTVTNSSDAVLNARIQVQVPGWSDAELRSVSVGAGEVRQLFFGPAFFPRFYSNHEIVAATAALKVSDSGNKVLHTETVPVRLRSSEDMYWGDDFKFAPFIASWVTPHDPRVESILAKAKEFMPGRRLPGYEQWKSPDQQRISTMAQAKAIYRALQQSGVSYVKSSLTFGRNTAISERVRLPGGSLQHLSANCIDGVVLYASLFENLGMDPVIVLIPGHAYIGVRDADASSSYIYFETAVTGRLPFETAVHAADKGLLKIATKDVIRIPVSQARSAGIFPMPVPGEDVRHFPSSDPSASATPPTR
jgi:hypothetical protein